MTTGRTVILPVRVEKCEMPPLLADKLYADLADDYDAAVAAVVQAVSQPGEQSGSAGAAAGFATHAGESVADVAIDGRLRAVPHEAGFFGRRREMWDIERWFAHGTRRISITGFGGQGKTELALESGRWLTLAGMFERAVFVDYAQVQSEDAVQVAVSHIGAVLDQTLSSPRDVSTVLAHTSTLVILDNLETITTGIVAGIVDRRGRLVPGGRQSGAVHDPHPRVRSPGLCGGRHDGASADPVGKSWQRPGTR